MKTILIVDDDHNIQELLRDALSQIKECAIITANDGEEALEKIMASPPDLIILDMMLPRISGNALFYDLKKLEVTKNTPVIFMSGTFVDKQIKHEAIKMGAVDYLDKPLDIEELISSVQSILSD